MEWSQEKIMLFIDLYRNKAILWDPQNPQHYNKLKKHDAWQQLADEVEATVDECKRKITSLLASLRREKAKITKSKGTGTGNLGSMSSGILLTWTSPVLPKLSDETSVNENPLGQAISSNEESWIGSCLALGAIFGPFFAGFAADRIGRKFTLLLCAGIPFFVSLIMLAFTQTVYLYYIARFIGGFGIGSLYTSLPMYFGEIAEPATRGAVASTMNVFIVTGELYSYCIGPYVSILVFSIICAIVPLAFLVLFYFFPESPYYLVAKQKNSAAQESLRKFRAQEKEVVEEELQKIKESVEKDMQNKGTFFDIFRSKGLTKALFICLGLGILQQLSGINVVLFYVTSVFQASGSSLDSNICSIIVGAVQLIASFSTPILVDRLGRKALLLISAVGMTIFQVALGLYFFLKENNGSASVSSIGWLPVLAVVGYIVTYNVGYGPLPWTVMGELFPVNVKSAASTTTASVCWLFGFLVPKFYPTLIEVVGTGITFWIFSGFCILAILFTAVCVIETKGKSLQEIQQLLNR